jgi:hypothetical protein
MKASGEASTALQSVSPLKRARDHEAGMDRPRSLAELAGSFVEQNGKCRILDLGSGLTGSWHCFELASPLITVVGVDIIFSGRNIIVNESPDPHAVEKAVSTPDHLNSIYTAPGRDGLLLVGQDINEILSQAGSPFGKFDVVIWKDVYSASLHMVSLARFCEPSGVVVLGHNSTFLLSSYSDLVKICQAGCFNQCWRLDSNVGAVFSKGGLIYGPETFIEVENFALQGEECKMTK